MPKSVELVESAIITACIPTGTNTLQVTIQQFDAERRIVVADVLTLYEHLTLPPATLTNEVVFVPENSLQLPPAEAKALRTLLDYLNTLAEDTLYPVRMKKHHADTEAAVERANRSIKRRGA